MEYNLEVPERLLDQVSSHIRADPDALDAHLLQAMEIGIKALAQASVGADTTVVADTFQRLADGLEGSFIGEGSDLSNSINLLFSDANSPFRRALDPMNKNSPLHSFLEKQGENIDGQTEYVKELVEGINKVLTEEFNKIRGELNIKTARAEEASKGTGKGKDFEKDIVANLNDWQKYPDSFEVVGDDAQEGTRRKVGDVLATTEIGWEIVMEAKAGANYGDTGDNSLDKQMDESMAYYSESRGSIAVTTTGAMDNKKWQNSLFLDRGKNRFIVALDWKPVEGCDDYTVLRIAYMLLRERILAESSTTEAPSGSGIDPKKIREITDDIVRDMSSATKMRQIMTDVEGRINAMREEITEYQNKIQSRVDELNTLL